MFLVLGTIQVNQTQTKEDDMEAKKLKDLAYYVKKADSIYPIYGVTSLEEAKRFVDP